MDRAPFYKTLEIVLNYLTLRGYDQTEADERARRHILKLCVEGGERRTLMLANVAIAAIEEEVKLEKESQTVVVADFYRHYGSH
jgi:hypothetical protein